MSSVSLGMTNHPRKGRGQDHVTDFLNVKTPVLSLEWVKLGT